MMMVLSAALIVIRRERERSPDAHRAGQGDGEDQTIAGLGRGAHDTPPTVNFGLAVTGVT